MSRIPLRIRGAAVVALLLVLAVTALLTAWPGGHATAAPSISDLRAQVQRIQSEVAVIDEQVGMAAEAYNGAVYELDQVTGRITANRAALAKATRRLRAEQGQLATRIRAAYVQPPPSRLQLLLSSSSVSALASGSEALQRSAAKDAEVIRAVQVLRRQRIAKAAELEKDRARAKVEVANRAKQRAVVEGLLQRRQAVLAGAKGALARELAAAQAREVARRREANRRARALVRARRLASTPTQPAPAAGSSSGSPAAAPSAGAPATVSGGGSARNAQAARIAMRYLGVPYRWGGATPSGGFDCSGLAMYAYGHVGVSMAHYTGAIWTAYPRVTGPLQPGDLVFFSGLGHMGIYIGGGQMVHAPHTGDVVRVSPMAGRRYVGAVRP